MPPTATDVTAVARGLSVCVPATLVYRAKAVEGKEMPFGRDTGLVPSNTVLDRVPGPPHGKGIFWGRNSRPVQ